MFVSKVQRRLPPINNRNGTEKFGSREQRKGAAGIHRLRPYRPAEHEGRGMAAGCPVNPVARSWFPVVRGTFRGSIQATSNAVAGNNAGAPGVE
jgi:hypothetical protein